MKFELDPKSQDILIKYNSFLADAQNQGHTKEQAKKLAQAYFGFNIPRLVFTRLISDDTTSTTETIPPDEQPMDTFKQTLTALDISIREEDQQRYKSVTSPLYTIPSPNAYTFQIVHVCRNPKDNFKIFLIELIEQRGIITGEATYTTTLVPQYTERGTFNGLIVIIDDAKPVLLSYDSPPSETSILAHHAIDIVKKTITSRQPLTFKRRSA